MYVNWGLVLFLFWSAPWPVGCFLVNTPKLPLPRLSFLFILSFFLSFTFSSYFRGDWSTSLPLLARFTHNFFHLLTYYYEV
ncbi:hypothetical protein DFH27DRAFT_570641 [Peziza echinospora]|nr:hypothetical protein DFH27DRAFT_570641 [Peziza echinospora]